jgi:hypothetical protein
MFVKDFVHVDRPFEALAPRFVDAAWLEPLVARAIGDGDLRCERGVVRRRLDALVVPMRWTMAHVALPSRLDGDLSIGPDGPTESWVTLEATYPIERSHREHRHVVEAAVQAAVHAFLVGLAAALQLDEGPPGPA